MTELTFLGTGNFVAPPGRYWNSFVLDASVLVEPVSDGAAAPAPLRLPVDAIEVVVVSHFHADHCFGWPFLLEAAAESGAGPHAARGGAARDRGAPGQHERGRRRGLGDRQRPRPRLDLRFVEVDGSWQEAGPLRFRAVEVVHVPYLRCFGYLFDRGSRMVGYSGDTTPCDGLSELAREADVLVVECNGRHTPPGAPTIHMDEESVRALQAAHPDVHLVLTHLGEQVDTGVAAAA